MEFENILVWLGSFWTLSTIGIPFIIEYIYRCLIKPSTTFWRSVWSWIIPITVFYIVWVVGLILDIGFLSEYKTWWTPGIMGIISASLSNFGWNNIPWVREIIIRIVNLLPKTKKMKNYDN